MRHYVIASLMLFGTLRVLGQSVSTEPHFSIVSYGGLLFPGYINWSFQGGLYDIPTRPRISLGIGAQYGPLANVKGALVNASLEVGFGQMGAVGHGEGIDKAEMILQRLPMLLWLTIETDNALSPYARIGSGVCETDFRETYSDASYPSMRFHRWTFGWGYGTGLRYRWSEAFEIALFVENWITEEKITARNWSGYERGIDTPYGDSPVGLRITYRI
jgi:hypothetical protein